MRRLNAMFKILGTGLILKLSGDSQAGILEGIENIQTPTDFYNSIYFSLLSRKRYWL
jgi:hypothetical protein